MIKGLILVGGKSHRFGSDKYNLVYRDKPQFLYLKYLFDTLSIESYFSINQEQVDEFEKYDNIIIDQFGSIGPLGAIASAFEFDPLATWLMVACDLPFVNVETLKKLIEAHDKKHDVITYKHPENPFPETTITLYSYPNLIKDSMVRQDFSLQRLLSRSRMKCLLPITSSELLNANTYDDYLKAMSMIAQNDQNNT